MSWDDLAVQVAEKIVDPSAINDRAVADLCACALWRQIVPEGHAAPPKDVLLAASQQVGSPHVLLTEILTLCLVPAVKLSTGLFRDPTRR